MKKQSYTAVGLILASCLALTGCSAETKPKPEVSSQVETTSAAPTASVTPTPTETVPPAPKCASLTGQEAIDKWIDSVPRDDPSYEWDSEYAAESTYDPCAALSWVVLPIVGAMGSSAQQIMLFHEGEFVRPATKIGYRVAEAKRISDDSISVTYMWVLDGESSADSSGRATSTYTWDPDTQQIVREGELPRGDHLNGED